jgi:hypothetical protein
MARSIDAQTDLAGQFVAAFGSPPGTFDAAAESANWKRLCERLRDELRERDEMILALQAMLDHAAPVDVDAILANRSDNTPMGEFIAELERELHG